MHICDVCGNTVDHIGFEQVCKPCLVWLKTKGRQQASVVKKAVEDKDNQEFMLAYFGITLEQFEAVTHDNLSDIVDSEFAGFYKNDAKRVLWHDYRANAFTKKGALKKVAEKEINAFISNKIEAQEAAVNTIDEIVTAKKQVKNTKTVTTAELFGAKKLTGSKKQKSWGEDIRTAFLSKLQSELALDMIVNSAMTQTAKFWIETRNINRIELENAFVNLVEATKKANEIGAGNDGYDEQLVIRSAALKLLSV